MARSKGNARGGRGSALAAIDPSRRIFIILGIFVGLALIIAARLVYLSLIVGPENAEDASVSRTETITLSPRRGTIYDRNGTVLATSIDAKTVYCDPSEVDDPRGVASKLAVALGGNPDDYEAILSDKNSTFAYIYRKADVEAGSQVESMDIKGVYVQDDNKRVYPCGQTAGQIVGLCSIDGGGLSGLELYYNDILAGQPGILEAQRGHNGQPIADSTYVKQPAVDGEDIVISIDVEMQEYVERRVKECAEKLKGKRTSAVLYDAGTGEIIAAASTPFLNPNDRENIEEGASDLYPISMSYEPGSIFKTVSMTAVMEEEALEPTDKIDCPAYLPADDYYISDAHPRNDEIMTVEHIMAVSSNVGISLSAEKMGFRPLYEYIKKYRVTESTGVDFPGEGSGRVDDVSNWSKVQSYNISFGQGVVVTPLSITRFYGALVNDGVICTPHFLINKPQTGEKPEYATEEVVQNKTAIPKILRMLQGVVAEGTGEEGQIEGFEPGGKTGTAEYVGEEGFYLTGMNNISFVGLLPDTSSQLVCFIGATEVTGDAVTADVFKDIMTFAINEYKITPQ